MTEAISWPAVVSAVLLALIAGLPGMIAAWRANKVGAAMTAQVAARSDTQDIKLNEIHEATNGGVQKLRDEVASLKALLATAVEDLRAERAKL